MAHHGRKQKVAPDGDKEVKGLHCKKTNTYGSKSNVKNLRDFLKWHVSQG